MDDTYVGLLWSMPIQCARCLWADVINAPLMSVKSVDFDDLNAEGSIDLCCPKCGTVYTTGLIHLEEVDASQSTS